MLAAAPPDYLCLPAVAPLQLQFWHQSPAGRYVILLCKQLKAAPLHSELLTRVAALTVIPMSLHINAGGAPINGIPERHVC